jgi:hypothetical protein
MQLLFGAKSSIDLDLEQPRVGCRNGGQVTAEVGDPSTLAQGARVQVQARLSLRKAEGCFLSISI